MRSTRAVHLISRQITLTTRRFSAKSFKYADAQIEEVKERQTVPDQNTLAFGRQFTDHMVVIKWTLKDGWEKPFIKPLTNFSMHPGSMTFHYAISLFEGMKAMRGDDEVIRIFRPEENMERMNITATRACLPTFEPDELIKLIKRLVQLDRAWVPTGRFHSLYIRPTLIASDAVLGVHAPEEAKLFVILCPVGFYYASGAKPVSLYADPTYVRAWPGGSGYTKMASNYAPTPYVQRLAEKHGCQQVLWLFGEDHQLTEVGTMNLFICMENDKGEKELITPPLKDGLILPGVTRASIISLCSQWDDLTVVERRCTMEEVILAEREGRLVEIFGSGTACVVSQVGRIWYRDSWIEIPTEGYTECKRTIAERVRQQLQDIQYGAISPHPWTQSIDEI